MFSKQQLVIVLICLSCLISGIVYGQSDASITEFRISPIGDTRLVRLPKTDYPVQYSGSDLQFEVWATDGTVRFSARDLVTGEYSVFGEFAGSEYSTLISTFEFARDNPVEFCAWNRGEGGWENADVVCTTIIVAMGTGCIPIADGGGGCPWDFPDWGELTYYRPDDVNLIQSEESCDGALSPTISVGERGRVTYTNGDPTSVYDEPQGTVLVRMPEGTEFDVVGGPVCTDALNGHLWWSQVETNDGTVGWAPYGYIGTPYWIEPAEINEDVDPVQSYTVTYPAHDYEYMLEVDLDECLIVNGHEVIAAEISRFAFWRSSLSWFTRVQQIGSYFKLVEEGDEIEGIDGLRFYLETEFSSIVECDEDLRYQVGTRTMDLSGLGNILFGYYAAWLPAEAENVIAHIDQSWRDRRLTFDHSDDQRQRRVGRAIYDAIGSINASVSPTTVQDVAESEELF
jgi:hypothetical protein